jgi:hypothetical protein
MWPDSDHSDRQLVEKKFSLAAAEQKHIELRNGELEPVSLLSAPEILYLHGDLYESSQGSTIKEPVPKCYASADWSSPVLDCVAHQAISYIPGLFRPLAK